MLTNNDKPRQDVGTAAPQPRAELWQIQMPAPPRPVVTITVAGEVVIADDASPDELRQALEMLGAAFYQVRAQLPVALFKY